VGAEALVAARSPHDGVRGPPLAGVAQVLRHHSLQCTTIYARVDLGRLCRALGVPPGTLYRLYLGSACINEIRWHGRGFASVHCVNDTSHLR
jgi:hypothetical protein